MGFFPYVNAPLFVAGDALIVTAGIDLLYKNAELLNLITRTGRDVAQGHSHAFEATAENPLAYWPGAFRYVTGLTTLTVVLDNQGVTGAGPTPRYRLKLNGVEKQTGLITSGVQTISYASLAAQGYANGATVDVDVEIYDTNGANPGASGWPGRFHFVDAYVSPVSGTMAAAWPGVPTFGTSLDVSKLNQLSNASDWLALRVNAVALPLFQWVRAMPGLNHLEDDGTTPIVYPIWSGGMGAGRGTMATLKLRYAYQINTGAESLRLFINGTQVATTGTLAAGASAIGTFSVSLTGYGSSTPLRFELVSTTTTPGARQSRFTVYRAWVEPGAIAVEDYPSRTTPTESMTPSELFNRLAALSALLGTVKSRIDAAPDLWDRQRVFRRGYGYDDGQRAYFGTRHLPRREYRIGAGLIVDGANVSIGWGAQTIVPPPAEEPDGEYDVQYAYEESLISGDTRATKIVSLDALAGLDEGFAYALKSPGGVRYAAEYLLR